ncbi:MAG: hypothetical protein IKQ46_03055 [Bacteroidales bacterium]|nr:hypothetical protein [Bacteroidales bacterium]
MNKKTENLQKEGNKQYQKSEIEIVLVNANDIICTSSTGMSGGTGEGLSDGGNYGF